MELIDSLLKSVSGADYKIKNVCVGLHWTVVESRYVGISHTYKTNKKVEIRDSGRLIGKSALELAHRIKDWEPLEASVGLAAINSLIKPIGRKFHVNQHILKIVPGKTVTIVGRFPFNDEVANLAKKTYLLEMEPIKDELPSFAAEDVIPKSDLVIISATALINKSLPRLLELSKNKRCIVLGPSTPMNEVLCKFGVQILAGVRVVKSRALFLSVMQGVKTFKKLKGIEPVLHSSDEN